MSDILDKFLAPASSSDGGDPLDEQIRRTQQQRASAAISAAPRNPDAAGEANVLARQTGLPPETVERNISSIKALQYTSSTNSVLQDNPRLADWAMNPRNAAVGVDDIHRLARVGQAGDTISAVSAPAPTFWNMAKGIGIAAKSAFSDQLVGAIHSVRDDILGNPKDASGRTKGQAEYDLARARADDSTPEFKSWWGRSLYGATTNLVQQAPGVAALVLTGNPLPAIAMGSAMAGTQGYGDIRAGGGSPRAAALGGLAIAGLEAATEYMPAGVIAKGLGRLKAPKVIAEFLAKELLGEEVATVTQNAVQTAATPRATWGDYVRQLPADMRDTAVAVGVAGLAMHGAGHIAHRVMSNGNDAQAAQAGTESIASVDAMMKEAGQSKTRSRDPDAFRQFIATHTEGTPAENLYIPAEKLRELYQSERFDPEDPAHRYLADFHDQVDQASPLGGDVVIPMADAVTHLAGSSAWDLIRGDVRVSPGGLSESEAKAYHDDHADMIDRQSKEMEAADAAEQEARAPEQKVYDDVFGQLRQAGYTADASGAYAQLWASRYAARAATLGTDALTAFQQSNVSVRQDAPAVVGTYRKADQMDLLINAMRGKDRQANDGPSLLEFISKQGGIEDKGGDIASFGGDRWHKDKAFRRRLIREAGDSSPSFSGMEGTATGFGLDDFAQKAHDAGYFPEHTDRPTPNDLLGAIEAELRGAPRHASKVFSDHERETNESLGKAAESLRGFLSNAGIDPDTATRAQIDAALKQDEADRSLEQADVDSPAFRSWFGGSKVVDASGRPLLVYHGSPDARFLQGDDARFKGENERYGLKPREDDGAHWFTPSRATAATYADDTRAYDYQAAEPAVTAFYLSLRNPLIVEAGGKSWMEAQARGRTSNVIKEARDAGHDGVVIRNVRDDYNESKKTKPTDTYVVFRSNQIKSATRNSGNFDPSDPRVYHQSARGQIDLYTDGRKVIRLFEGRDLSTMLHESGHLWLEEMAQDATSEGASDQLKADWQTVQDWFKANGHETGAEIPTEAHELFARGFERYAMEGKAPTTALRAVFDRFRSWLLRIYQVFDHLNAPITPEIRSVFDRMLATQDEIDMAAQGQNLKALFTDAAQAGMTEEEFAAYQKASTDARGEAYDALIYRTMEAIRRQRTKEWKTEERGVRDDVTGQINARPEFRALHLLRTGKWLGEPEREGVKVRLDKQWLVDNYGTEALTMLPKGVPPIYGETNTTNAEDLADLTGFRSSDDLVRSLMGIEQAQKSMREEGDKRTLLKRLTSEETAAEMASRHGDPLNDGSIEEEALAAVHNDRQGELIASEARALSRRANGAPTPYRIAREWAQRKIAEGKVVDVASRSAIQRYAKAAAKASKLAEEAILKGDVDETFRQKQSQLLNHALLAEAKKAADEVDSAVKRLGYLAGKRTIASVDQDHLDRAHGLLEKFNFRPASQKALNEQASFAVWAEDRRANGVDVLTPPRLEDKGEHYSRISVEELRGLRDSVEQLVQLGRLKQKLADGKDQRDFDEVVAEAVDGAGRLKQKPPSDLMEPSWGERFKAGVASADAALLKMETAFDWLDGGKSDGVFNRVVFRPISEAQDRENDMLGEYLGHVRKAISTVTKAVLKRWDDKVTIPELINRETGRPFVMNRQALISMALNMGNAGNIQRLTDGYGWNEQMVRSVLNRELTAPEWQFVQKTWDILDGLWPHISEMEKRINGFAPEKVDAVPIETPHGTFPGGYYPAVYDSRRNLDAEANAGKAGDLFETMYTRATTRASSANDRVAKVVRPILLDLGVINRHLGETIHDITHREAVMNADRFLSSQRVMAAVDRSLGPEVRKQFRPWLKFVANRWAMERAGNEGLGKFLNKARSNATIVGMGFRFSTMMTQIAGFSNSAEVVGEKHLVQAIASSAASPIDTFRFVTERSGEMRHRMDTLDRDIGASIRALSGRTDILADVKRFAFHGIGYMDRAVSVPTWIAGYNKALSEGMSEEDAGYAADKALRQSQGAGSAKDLAAIQRGNGKWGEALKLMTMFYSYLSAFYQRQRSLGRDVGSAVSAGRGKDLPRLMARAWWLLAVPAVLSELLAGRGPDDDEDWALWSFRKMLGQSLGPIPILRDFFEPAWNKATGKPGFDGSISPIQRAFQSGVNVAGDVGQLARGEDTKHATKDTMEAAGYATGLVPGQLASATQFLVDLGQGDQHAETAGDFYRGLTTGKAEPKR